MAYEVGNVGSKTIEDLEESSEKENLRRIEAIFFISGRFLSVQEIVSLSDLNPIIVKELISELKEKYEKNDSALEIVEKSGSYKMDVRQEYSGIINRLATGRSEFTKAEQETLAIIAYKQPIKQSVIIKIRGNKAYDHIKKFEDLNLIKRKKTGHTHDVTLSEEFYDYFSVQDKEGRDVLKQIDSDDSDDELDEENENEVEHEE